MGVLAYELASGKAPFTGKHEAETKKNIRDIKFSIPKNFSLNL
jgi:hypothetical protein